MTAIFDGKIGQPYSEERLREIFQEGEKRYQKQLPPGFSDSKKESNRKYGDLILWNQLKDFCRVEKKPLILVTDDKKEDWWQEHKGKTIGPRPELIQEMRSEAGVKFYMYQSDRFIEYAQKLFNLGTDKAVEEVREVRRESDITTFPPTIRVSPSRWVRIGNRKYSRIQYVSAIEIYNNDEQSTALQYISRSPRTFPELRKLLNDDSKLARNVLQSFLAAGIVEKDPSDPDQFALSQFGKRVERLVKDLRLSADDVSNVE